MLSRHVFIVPDGSSQRRNEETLFAPKAGDWREGELNNSNNFNRPDGSELRA